MIQRIQSLFMLLAAALNAGACYVPFATAQPTEAGILADGQFTLTDSTLLLILAGLTGLLALVNIFLHSNRVLQQNLNKLNLVLIAAFTGLGIVNALGLAESTLSFGPALPVLAIVMLFLANANIKKDEQLVRSADRIR